VARIYEDVNNIVIARLRNALAKGETINVPDWVSELSECLVDMILCGAPAEEHAKLLAHAHQKLNDFFVKKGDAGLNALKH
jgi:hypothetical protein